MTPKKDDWIQIVSEETQHIYCDYVQVEAATAKAILIGDKWIPRSQLTENGYVFVQAKNGNLPQYTLSEWMAKTLGWE